MRKRRLPPGDITPAEFFGSWLGEAVAGDEARRRKIAEIDARIQFELGGPDGGPFFLVLREGVVEGAAGRVEDPDLTLTLEVETWRRLNTGDLNAPQAVLSRDLRFKGSLYLALRLHTLLD